MKDLLIHRTPIKLLILFCVKWTAEMDREIQLVYNSGKVHSLYIFLINEMSQEKIYNLYCSQITIFKDVLASKTKCGISERKSQLRFDVECVKSQALPN